MKRYIATGTQPPFHRQAFRQTQKEKCYFAILDGGQDGLTRPEIAAKVGLQVDRINFYLSELRRAGFITYRGAPVDISKLSAADAALVAMESMENALVAKAKEEAKKNKGVLPQEMEKAFARYQKVKALALGGQTSGELRAALRLALIELVKMVF